MFYKVKRKTVKKIPESTQCVVFSVKHNTTAFVQFFERVVNPPTFSFDLPEFLEYQKPRQKRGFYVQK